MSFDLRRPSSSVGLAFLLIGPSKVLQKTRNRRDPFYRDLVHSAPHDMSSGEICFCSASTSRRLTPSSHLRVLFITVQSNLSSPPEPPDPPDPPDTSSLHLQLSINPKDTSLSYPSTSSPALCDGSSASAILSLNARPETFSGISRRPLFPLPGMRSCSLRLPLVIAVSLSRLSLAGVPGSLITVSTHRYIRLPESINLIYAGENPLELGNQPLPLFVSCSRPGASPLPRASLSIHQSNSPEPKALDLLKLPSKPPDLVLCPNAMVLVAGLVPFTGALTGEFWNRHFIFCGLSSSTGFVFNFPTLQGAESPWVNDLLSTHATELEVAAYSDNPPPITGVAFNFPTSQAAESPWINDLLSTLGTELEVANYGDNPPPTTTGITFNFPTTQADESPWVNDLLLTHSTELEVAVYGDNPPPTLLLSFMENVFKRSARATNVVHSSIMAKELQIALRTIILEALSKKLPVCIYDSNCITYLFNAMSFISASSSFYSLAKSLLSAATVIV